MGVKKIAGWVGGLFVTFMGIGLVGSILTPSSDLTALKSSPTVSPAVLGQKTVSSITPTVVTASPRPVAKITPKPTAKPTPKPTTKPIANTQCDPNYSGACVPSVYPADVDCAGGSGNGPYYVKGPVTVTGSDRYQLDRDKDGYACE